MPSRAWSDVRFRCVLGLAVIIALAACVPAGGGGTPTATLDPSLVDLSLVTGLPCAPPCWYGLELGRSTKADVIATARTLSFIDASEFPEQSASYWDPVAKKPVPARLLSLKRREPKGYPGAGLILVDDILMEVVPFATLPLTLGEAVAHLGPPEFVRMIVERRDPSLCDVALIWKQRGIWVAYLNLDSASPSQRQAVRCSDVWGGKGVKPDLPVGQILYQLPDQFADVPHAEGDFPWSGFAQP